MTSTAGSTTPSRNAPVARAAVVTHGKVARIGPALTRLEEIADRAGVHLVVSAEDNVVCGHLSERNFIPSCALIIQPPPSICDAALNRREFLCRKLVFDRVQGGVVIDPFLSVFCRDV